MRDIETRLGRLEGVEKVTDEGDLETISLEDSEGTVLLPSAIQKAVGDEGIYILAELSVEMAGTIEAGGKGKKGWLFTPKGAAQKFTLAAGGKSLETLKAGLARGVTSFKVEGVVTEPEAEAGARVKKKPLPHIEVTALSEGKRER